MNLLIFAALFFVGAALISLRIVKHSRVSRASMDQRRITIISAKQTTHYQRLYIPILGLPESGKTLTLATLCDQLCSLKTPLISARLLTPHEEEQVRRRQLRGVTPRDVSMRGRRSTRAMIDAERAALQKHSAYDSSRIEESGYVRITYRSSVKGPQSETAAITVWEDLPGDFIQREHLFESNIDPRLASASGMILVMNGAQIYRHHEDALLSEYTLPYQQLLERYRQLHHGRGPIWVIVTKSDLLPAPAQNLHFWRQLITQKIITPLHLTKRGLNERSLSPLPSDDPPSAAPLIVTLTDLIHLNSHPTQTSSIEFLKQAHGFLNDLHGVLIQRGAAQQIDQTHARVHARLYVIALLSFTIASWLILSAIHFNQRPAIYGERAWSTSSLETTRDVYLDLYRESASTLSPLYVYRAQLAEDLRFIYHAHKELLSSTIDQYLLRQLARLKTQADHYHAMHAIDPHFTCLDALAQAQLNQIHTLAQSITQFQHHLHPLPLQETISTIDASLQMLLEDVDILRRGDHLLTQDTSALRDPIKRSLSREFEHWSRRCRRGITRGCQVIEVMHRSHVHYLYEYSEAASSWRPLSSSRDAATSPSRSSLSSLWALSQWSKRGQTLQLPHVYRTHLAQLSEHLWRQAWSRLEDQLHSDYPTPRDHIEHLVTLRGYTDEIFALERSLSVHATHLPAQTFREPQILKRRRMELLRIESLALARRVSSVPSALQTRAQNTLDWSATQLDARRALRIRFLVKRNHWRHMTARALKIARQGESLQPLREVAARLHRDLKSLRSSSAAHELKRELTRWMDRVNTLDTWLAPHQIQFTAQRITCTHEALVQAQEHHSWKSLKRYTDLKHLYIMLSSSSTTPSPSSRIQRSLAKTNSYQDHALWIAIDEGASERLLWTPGAPLIISVYERDGQVDRETQGREHDDTLIGSPHRMNWMILKRGTFRIELNRERTCHAQLSAVDSWPKWIEQELGTVE